jgi:hypothetical protein
MLAHIAEHVALKYAQVQRGLGVPVPPINLSAQPGQSIAGAEAPQQSDAIAIAAAQQMGAFMQQSGLTMTPPSQTDPAQVDEHHESLTRQWMQITAGMASLAKAGSNLQGGLQDEAAVLGADGNPVQPGQGGAPPVRSPGPAPAPAMARPVAAPAPQPHVPAPIAPGPQHPLPSPGNQ